MGIRYPSSVASIRVGQRFIILSRQSRQKYELYQYDCLSGGKTVAHRRQNYTTKTSAIDGLKGFTMRAIDEGCGNG